MGITKLLYIGEGKKSVREHLNNAIDYILDEKKTSDGVWVGGNSGVTREEIVKQFVETKQEWNKLDKRQAYHFIISFEEGEADAETVYQVAKEFCEEYLGDHYDYVFAVHDDKNHKHAHIIFNSVSRTDGYKYRYEKGDWEKYIQPITDRISVRHGLKPLVWDEKQKKGKSYAEWQSEKENGYNQTDIIRADMDYAIEHSSSVEEVQNALGKMGYKVRVGFSKKRGEKYFSISHPNFGQARRSYNLGYGYSWSDIEQRIKGDNRQKSYEDLTDKMERKAGDYLSIAAKNKGVPTYRRMYQAVSWYKLPNPYAVSWSHVRKDMLELNRLLRDCRYVKQHSLYGTGQMRERLERVEAEIKTLVVERKTKYRIGDHATEEQQEDLRRYLQLRRGLFESSQNRDDRFEDLEDEIASLEAKYPSGFLENSLAIQTKTQKLKELRKEKRLLDQLLQQAQKEKIDVTL